MILWYWWHLFNGFISFIANKTIYNHHLKIHNYKLIQAGGWLRRSLIWPPAQSKAITKCRLGGSRFCPDKSCKISRIELSQHVWKASSVPNCPQGEKCFLICSLKLLCSNFWALPLNCPARHLCRQLCLFPCWYWKQHCC